MRLSTKASDWVATHISVEEGLGANQGGAGNQFASNTFGYTLEAVFAAAGVERAAGAVHMLRGTFAT